MSPDSPVSERRLDVRHVDGEPFGTIVAALEDLPENASLRLINSFEPEPLYDVLEQRGFAYETTHPEPDVWHVEIRHA